MSRKSKKKFGSKVPKIKQHKFLQKKTYYSCNLKNSDQEVTDMSNNYDQNNENKYSNSYGENQNSQNKQNSKNQNKNQSKNQNKDQSENKEQNKNC